MVNEAVLIKDKYADLKRFLKVIGIIILIGFITFLFIFAFKGIFTKPATNNITEKKVIILENPMKNIIMKYKTPNNTIETKNIDKIINEGILNFNSEYINYILIALGVKVLHKSPTLENPFIELVLDNETWNSEIIKGTPHTKKGKIKNPDIIFILTKKEAVKALLSKNIQNFMKDSVKSGRTKIKMIAGKAKLFSKGYLTLYNKLTEKNSN